MAEQPEIRHRFKSFSEFSMSMLSSIYGPTFRTICPQSYTLQEIDPGCAPEYKHYFCGPHDVPGAFCPNCQKPLLRLLALDTRDPRLGLTYCPFPVLSLLHCMTCEILNGVFYYQIHAPDGRISILDYKEGTVQKEYIPFYPKPYPRFFPGIPVQFAPLSDEQQWYIIEGQRLSHKYTLDIYNYDMEKRRLLSQEIQAFHEQYYHQLKKDAHQIGGFPELTQGWEGMTGQGWEGHICPVCNEEMTFLAALDDQNTDPRGFVGTVGQFLYAWCPRCFVIETVGLE